DATSQTTASFPVIAARSLPSRLNVRSVIPAVAGSVATTLRRPRSQRRTPAPEPADASIRPDPKATASAGPLGPGWTSGAPPGARVTGFHKRILPSSPTDARTLPSRLNAISLTGP